MAGTAAGLMDTTCLQGSDVKAWRKGCCSAPWQPGNGCDAPACAADACTGDALVALMQSPATGLPPCPALLADPSTLAVLQLCGQDSGVNNAQVHLARGEPVITC